MAATDELAKHAGLQGRSCLDTTSTIQDGTDGGPAGPADDPDATSVRRILAGDPSAFAEIVARNEQPLRRLVVGLLGDRHLAEDVLQEVLWIAYQRLAGFQFRARFRTWISRIAVRKALGARARLRSWLRRPLSLDGRDVPSRQEGTGDDDIEITLRHLQRLPAPERVALVLLVEGHAYHEIAELLSCPIGTVSARIHRARERLAAMGGAKDAEPPAGNQIAALGAERPAAGRKS